ncbi:MAG: acylphosphatase [Armatimonadetes bacterium]|nr:acylphosphatase [Armatimonadota bacterium]
MPTGRKAVRLVVHGSVQGVGFRFALLEHALSNGLTGWCRNGPGGSVEAFLSGPGATVDQVVEWCHTGPPMARVDEVEVESASVADAPKDFTIRH